MGRKRCEEHAAAPTDTLHYNEFSLPLLRRLKSHVLTLFCRLSLLTVIVASACFVVYRCRLYRRSRPNLFPSSIVVDCSSRLNLFSSSVSSSSTLHPHVVSGWWCCELCRAALRIHVLTLGTPYLLLQLSTAPKSKRAERESERVVCGRSAERIKRGAHFPKLS